MSQAITKPKTKLSAAIKNSREQYHFPLPLLIKLNFIDNTSIMTIESKINL